MFDATGAISKLMPDIRNMLATLQSKAQKAIADVEAVLSAWES